MITMLIHKDNRFDHEIFVTVYLLYIIVIQSNVYIL